MLNSSGKPSTRTQVNGNNFIAIDRFIMRKYYGLYNDPLKAQGAGCSAFGASFLKATGLMQEEFSDNWTYSVNIPTHLIGKPVFEQKVWPWDLYFARQSWAKTTEPHKRAVKET